MKIFWKVLGIVFWGFVSVVHAQDASRKVAVTVDDVPVVQGEDLETLQQVTTDLLATFERHRTPAIGFVNEGRIYVRSEVDTRILALEQWLEAGMLLGNHTYSHLSLYEVPLANYEDDVIRGEVITRRIMAERGLDLRYFRYPYTHTGPTVEIKEAFEAFLDERDYEIAPFTVETADYAFDAIFVRALSDGDKELAQRIRSAYLDHTETVFDFCERLSTRLFGYEIPQILLIHANRLNADCLGDVLDRLDKRGYHFVTLDEALRDEAYRTPDEFIGRMGPSWFHRWSLHKGIPMKEINGKWFPATLLEEPDPPDFVLELYQQLQGRE
jgi:peptidoglycan/xylan/chitin deacetylase (PgdA/CDA1 family)